MDEDTKTLEILTVIRRGDPYALEKILTKGLSVDWNWNTRYGTPLMIASYFGQLALVKLVLVNGADVNLQNKEGDTALHKASLTGRLDILGILLKQPDISLVAENANGETAADVAKSKEVVLAIDAARQKYIEETIKHIFAAAKSADVNRLEEILSNENIKLIDFNTKDPLNGNTLLHYVAKIGNDKLVVKILQHGADPNVLNELKQSPADLTASEPVKLLLRAPRSQELLPSPISQSSTSLQTSTKLSGQLDRWTNYATGWKKRWFTVENGMLFWYNSSKEVQEGSRGSIRLQGAQIMVKKSDSKMFMIKGRNTMVLTLRAANETERKKWLVVLVSESKSRLNKAESQIFDLEIADKSYSELNLSERLEKKEKEKEKQPVESIEVTLEAIKWQKQSMDKLLESIAEEMKENLKFHEKSSIFISSGESMMEMVSNLVKVSEERATFWRNKFEKEEFKRLNLEESLKILVTEREKIEKEVIDLMKENGLVIPHQKDEEEEFFDAEEPDGETRDGSYYQVQSEAKLETSQELENGKQKEKAKDITSTKVTTRSLKRRTSLVAPMLDRSEVGLWAVLKEFVGKDISKIAVPVYFNEPLSFLQKFAEDLEYWHLLVKASEAKTREERMAYIAAFAISPYSSTTRVAKPFNPILGETFEMEREDLGYKYFAEQVSHHPPVSACHCDANKFTYWAEAHIKNRFLGNTLEVIPEGTFHVLLKETNEHFYWNRVRTCVHNLIVGTIWIDSYGEMKIVNSLTGDTCTLTFKPRGWWGKNHAEVHGPICVNGVETHTVQGHWNEKVTYSSVNNPTKATPLWKINPPLPGSDKYYYFTHFAIELNELIPGLQECLPPTDSRLRPDQRALENGDIQKATSEKVRIEQKQREARKQREEKGIKWQPRWFTRELDADSNKEYWQFNGEYWKRREEKNWEGTEEIF